MTSSSCVIPGERLGSSADFTPGNGTYVRHGYVHASLAGFRHVETHGSETPVLSVIRNTATEKIVPETGVLVTCRVMSTNPRFCKVAILCVGNMALMESFRGMIRKEDVRKMEKDKVDIYKCFCPGDIVRARVISLGDSQSYLLTTAENDLGVIYAESEDGVAMVPISWEEMQCPHTKTKHPRKVAKVHRPTEAASADS